MKKVYKFKTETQKHIFVTTCEKIFSVDKRYSIYSDKEIKILKRFCKELHKWNLFIVDINEDMGDIEYDKFKDIEMIYEDEEVDLHKLKEFNYE